MRALQSQFSEHLAILGVELPFHIDPSRRQIDEDIVRMGINVGDVFDAQLRSALNLALGGGLVIDHDFQEFGFYRRVVGQASWATTARSEGRVVP